MTLLYYHLRYIINENSSQDNQQTAGTTRNTHLRRAFSHTFAHLCPCQWTSNPCHRMQEGDWYSFLFGISPQAHTMWSSRSSHSTPCNCLGQLSLQQRKQEMLYLRIGLQVSDGVLFVQIVEILPRNRFKIDGNYRNGQAQENWGSTLWAWTFIG